jgi:hypothetical protein
MYFRVVPDRSPQPLHFPAFKLAVFSWYSGQAGRYEYHIVVALITNAFEVFRRLILDHQSSNQRLVRSTLEPDKSRPQHCAGTARP